MTERLPATREGAAIVASPVLMLVGLLGLAAVIPVGPLWLVPVLVSCLGGGIGVGWAYVNKWVMSFAAPDDGEVAAACIPTTRMFGFAFGAALSGLVANTSRFAGELTMHSAATVASWLFLGFALAPAVGALAAMGWWPGREG